ncbi:MAG: DUF3800 domain-containing protein [Phycisphaerales bacterium]|nr:DUF3800 domain-containing protein [Phycisphaerales bacterium]
MLVFLDESFRKHRRTGAGFSVIAGVAIPEDTFSVFQRDWFEVVRPYHGVVLKADHDVHGNELLGSTTMRVKEQGKYSAHWSLAEDLLNYSITRKFRVFGVVCFQDEYQSLICANDTRLDTTYMALLERVDLYMREKFPQRFVKLVFDDRGHSTNAKNGRATTNFLSRSTRGMGYDSIIKTPFFGVSKANNYGLQLADLVTTVISCRFQGNETIYPLWLKAKHMFYRSYVGEQRISSLRVLRKKTDSAAAKPMTGEKVQHRVSSTIIGSEVAPVKPIRTDDPHFDIADAGSSQLSKEQSGQSLSDQ